MALDLGRSAASREVSSNFLVDTKKEQCRDANCDVFISSGIQCPCMRTYASYYPSFLKLFLNNYCIISRFTVHIMFFFDSNTLSYLIGIKTSTFVSILILCYCYRNDRSFKILKGCFVCYFEFMHWFIYFHITCKRLSVFWLTS